jgi:hypothetical protein
MIAHSSHSRLVHAGIDVEARKLIEQERELIRIGVSLGPAEIFVADSDSADAELIRWLQARGVGEQSILAVGWNVTAMHLPFVQGRLPGFCSRYLTRHTVGLETLCYTLAENKTYGDTPKSCDEWQAMAKRAAELRAKIGYEVEPRWEDAGYRALTSLFSWQWFRDIVIDPRPASKVR